MNQYVKASQLRDLGVPYTVQNIKTLADFPKPVQFGERKQLYIRAEVEAWVANKIAASRA
jgi:predicted DNA-binding transcriptional regulator AlpA